MDSGQPVTGADRQLYGCGVVEFEPDVLGGDVDVPAEEVPLAVVGDGRPGQVDQLAAEIASWCHAEPHPALVVDIDLDQGGDFKVGRAGVIQVQAGPGRARGELGTGAQVPQFD